LSAASAVAGVQLAACISVAPETLISETGSAAGAGPTVKVAGLTMPVNE
jgi:hypothetical protein